jgi:hypothetical protein
MNIEMDHVQQQSAVTSLSIYCFLISAVQYQYCTYDSAAGIRGKGIGQPSSTSSTWPVFLHNKKFARKEKTLRAMQMTIILLRSAHACLNRWCRNAYSKTAVGFVAFAYCPSFLCLLLLSNGTLSLFQLLHCATLYVIYQCNSFDRSPLPKNCCSLRILRLQC